MCKVRTLAFLVAAAAALGVVNFTYTAFADDPDRSIPTMDVSSPSPGAIHVVWGTPGDTDGLSSYRLSWGPDGGTSYTEPNTDTGGNAYPGAPATSYTITGLAAGEYVVLVRSRYTDNRSGAWKRSAEVTVAGNDSTPTPEPTPEPTAEPAPEVTREIPSIEATSPSDGTIVVTWTTPTDTDGLSSYRVSWGLWENGWTSYSVANSETGGNAYPEAPANSYTITGLTPDEYIAAVVARYTDNSNSAFKESGKVTVGGTSDQSNNPPRTDPPVQQDPDEPLVSEQQQADACGTIEISDGFARNNGVGVFFDTPDRDSSSCSETFWLFVDKGDGNWAVASSGVTSPDTRTAAGTNLRYLWYGKAETEVIYAVRVASGCDDNGDECNREDEASGDDPPVCDDDPAPTDPDDCVKWRYEFEMYYRSLSNHSDAARAGELGKLVANGIANYAATGGLLLPGASKVITERFDIDRPENSGGPHDPGDRPTQSIPPDFDYEAAISGSLWRGRNATGNLLGRNYVHFDVDAMNPKDDSATDDTYDEFIYRVPMTKGRRYIFTEGGTRLDYMLGRYRAFRHEVRGGDVRATDQFTYLRDEVRITLYQLVDGALTPVTGCKVPVPSGAAARTTAPGYAEWNAAEGSCVNQPRLGWQKVGSDSVTDLGCSAEPGEGYRAPEFDYEVVAYQWWQSGKFILDAGTSYETRRTHEGANSASSNALVNFLAGAYQLRTVEYTPTASGIYYLGITQVIDDTLAWPLDGNRTGHFGAPIDITPHPDIADDLDVQPMVFCMAPFDINGVANSFAWAAEFGDPVNDSDGYYHYRNPDYGSVGIVSVPAATSN